MEWNEWEPLYRKILEEFNFDEKKDEEAGRRAYEIGKEMRNVIQSLHVIEGKPAAICGAMCNEGDIKEIKKMRDAIIISADEATTFLLKNGILPDIITTDLDGNIDDIIKANEMGSVAVIHAHGDNMEAIDKHMRRFKGKIMITVQSKPFSFLRNFGGFTDGDRAYCIAQHFKAKEIKLFGFDFENPKEKEGKDTEIKKRKLKWAKKIIMERPGRDLNSGRGLSAV